MTKEKISGIMIYYYFVCKRKLWFYHNGISLEDENENVQIGRFIDENTYSGERKHILINDEINIDFIKKSGMIHEIKKSKKIEEASIWQVKYYLYYLKNYGVENVRAKIDYPLLKQTVEVTLSAEDEERMKEMIEDIKRILQSEKLPDGLKGKVCKKCAFFDLCMI